MSRTSRPTRVGQYHVLDTIAGGRFADVYLARASVSGGVVQTVALKCLRPRVACVGERLRSFLREVRVAGCMNHPNVVQVFDVGEDGGLTFVAMEFLPGWTLRTVLEAALERGEEIPLDVCLGVVHQLAGGAHHVATTSGGSRRELQLVHRDIGFDNVMVDDLGHVTIIDFGSVVSAQSSAQSRVEVVRPDCLAPEVAAGRRADCTADVYSLGMVLHQLASTAGRQPADLTGVIARAVNPDRRQRFRSALDLQRALEDVARAMGCSLAPPPIGELVGSLCGRIPIPGPVRRRRETDGGRARLRGHALSKERGFVQTGCADPITVA